MNENKQWSMRNYEAINSLCRVCGVTTPEGGCGYAGGCYGLKEALAHVQRSTWKVKLNRGRHAVTVEADYHVIEANVLKFRNTARNSYPVNVIAFAAGEWVSVENMSIPTKQT